MSRLAEVIGWAPAATCLLGAVAAFALRDLLTGNLTPAQLRALRLAQPSPSAARSTDDLAAIGRKAQRAQWFAVAGLTVAAFFSIRPLVWWLEGVTAPGVPWIIGTVVLMWAGMNAADAIIHTVQPPQRTGRWTTRLLFANHGAFAACSLLTIAPWFFQAPVPRTGALNEYVTYYSPHVAGFIAALGAQIYGPFVGALLSVLCWREARREREPAVRLSLRLVATGAVIAQGTVLIQSVQAFTWMRGKPMWTEQEAAIAQLACQVLTPTLLILGCCVAPIVDTVRARSTRVFMQLWREDVIALRAPWRLLQGVYRTAYEPEADQRTQSERDELYAQRARMASEIMDALVQAADDLSPTARSRVEQLLRLEQPSFLRRRLGRPAASLARAVLSVVGGFAPSSAGRWWRRITEGPLQSTARADAACASAAIQLHLDRLASGDEGARPRSVTPILTISPRDVDEAVAYLRLLWRALRSPEVQEAGTAGFVAMIE
ncbi:hypothetical protein [Kineococcus sp. R86509]|uniref:hypothetical protein n=1 Tax=Kineococcus sp. R86509 TaxID=3093851 RepID=UPI0036D25FE7